MTAHNFRQRRVALLRKIIVSLPVADFERMFEGANFGDLVFVVDDRQGRANGDLFQWIVKVQRNKLDPSILVEYQNHGRIESCAEIPLVHALKFYPMIEKLLTMLVKAEIEGRLDG